MGLVHYRRHFAGKGKGGVLSKLELDKLLQKSPIVVPKKRNYRIETIESHYGNTFDIKHIDILRGAIEGQCPEYLDDFEHVMKSTSAHMFNMFVMRKDLLDSYCGWMFPILDVVDHELDYSQMSPFEARAVGRLSERLLEVWLIHNRMSFVETPVLNTEKTNWIVKGGSFLAASLFGKKYEKSF